MPSLESPMLSVVVPTYRRQESLERCIAALLAQEVERLEILLVDQNPPGYLQGLAAIQDPRVRRIVQAEPNASIARNRGFVAARAPLVLFIDDDLVPEADFARRAQAVFDQRPDIGCLCPVVHGLDQAAAGELEVLRRRMLDRPATEADPFPIAWTMSAALFFRREVFRATGGFDGFLFRHTRASEDVELFARMGRRGIRAWVSPTVTIAHDEHVAGGAEMRTVDYWENRRRVFRSTALIARFLSRRPPALDAAGAWRLLRSALLNRVALGRGPAHAGRQAAIAWEAVGWSRELLRDVRRASPEAIDHFAEIEAAAATAER